MNPKSDIYVDLGRVKVLYLDRKSMQEEAFFTTIYQDKYRDRYIEKLIALSRIDPKDPQGDEKVIEYLQKFYFMTTRSKETFQYKKLLNNFATELAQIFRWMVAQVLKVDKYQTMKFKLLQAQKSQKVHLKKSEVIFLLSLMCLNLVPQQQLDHTKGRKFSWDRNFAYIFSQVKFKTVAIIAYIKHYFKMTHQKQSFHVLTLSRKVCSENIQNILEKYDNFPLSQIQIGNQYSNIDDRLGGIKIDFANKKIGGGVMKLGSAQEQLLFVHHPEMFVSILLCEDMQDNQAIQFIGFRKYFVQEGFGKDKTKIKGFYKQKYEYDQQNRAKQQIIAIDAVDYSKKPQSLQYQKKSICRDIFKAYTGFRGGMNKIIVTGSWGCGAFKGDSQLKFLIQWIAASLAGKQLYYCTFSEPKYLEKYLVFGKNSIGDIYRAITKSEDLNSEERINFYEELCKVKDKIRK